VPLSHSAGVRGQSGHVTGLERIPSPVQARRIQADGVSTLPWRCFSEWNPPVPLRSVLSIGRGVPGTRTILG
jgi:hypothetical protein